MIHIIADTTCSIPVPDAQKRGLTLLPQMIIFGENTYRDDNEITTEEFLRKLKSSPTLPKTAAPPPALYNPIFQECASSGDTAIVITPSAELSGTFRSASIAAQDFPHADIRIIDSRTIGSGLGMLVMRALEWSQSNLSADEVVVKVEEMRHRERVYFFVDTLEYLYKGGRIGAAKMLFGSLLQMKPILTLQNGITFPMENQRTRKRALQHIRELVKSEFPTDDSAYISIMEGDAAQEASLLVEEIKGDLGINHIPVFRLPPAIITHAGPGCLAVSFFAKTPKTYPQLNQTE